jgi:hypothetical protein
MYSSISALMRPRVLKVKYLPELEPFAIISFCS